MRINRTLALATAATAAALPVATTLLVAGARARAARRRRAITRPVILSSDAIVWEPISSALDLEIDEEMDIEQCLLWGDLARGPYGAFFQFAPDFDAPSHVHSGAMRMVVLSGAFVLTPDGEPPQRLGPGSYFCIPALLPHASAVDPVAGCLALVEQEKGFDVCLID